MANHVNLGADEDNIEELLKVVAEELNHGEKLKKEKEKLKKEVRE